jgi:ubiquinone/menaquinone biosynthesis C-methylase UbiE
MKTLNVEYTSIYDELPLWSASFGLKLLEEVPLKRNIKALDIGFGTGFPLLEIAQRLGDSSVVYGIDCWEEAISRAKEKISVMGLKNIRIYHGNAERMPFRDAYFDLVISNNGLNNVPDMNTALKEVCRVSKKGTPLLFTVNLPGTMNEFYSIFQSVLDSHGMQNEIKKMNIHISEKRKSIDEISQLIAANGFELSKVEEECFHMKFMDGTTFLNHFFIKIAFLESWQQIVPMKEVRAIFAEAEDRLNAYSKDKGCLSLTIPFALFCCNKK